MLSQNYVEDDARKITEIVQTAGGELVGRTRLQKTVYLLTIAGLIDGFEFEYKHYGPYSEAVSTAALCARLEGLLREEERQASWGGRYSTYSVVVPATASGTTNPSMKKVVEVASTANAVALELAATAAFLAVQGYDDPWNETECRKPEKASQIQLAKSLYSELMRIPTPRPLPAII